MAFSLLGGLESVHADRVPLTGGVLFAPNHLSHLDPPLVACATRRATGFMAKLELFHTKLFGALIRSLDAFPVKRGETDVEAIKEAVRRLEGGRAVLVFPEGTRGDGETLGPISTGISMLAKRSGAKVCPVGIVGTHKVLAKGAKKLTRHKMKVVFGEPFAYDDVPGADEKERRANFVAELERRMIAACAEGGLTLRSASTSQTPTGSSLAETSTESKDPSSV